MRYSRGSYEKLPSGSYRAAYHVGGKRYRATFPTLALAKDWLLDQTAEEAPLTAPQRKDAANALSLLPEGVTLTQAAEYYLAAHPIASAQSLKDMFIDYLADREKDLRAKTLEGYRQCLNRTLRQFNILGELTTEALRQWLATMTPSNKNATLRTLSAFFTWAIDRNLATSNPTEKIALAKTNEPGKVILSIDQARHLLACALDTPCFHYIAICMFAGLRPEETLRLTPANIGAEYITVESADSKTHLHRTVTIYPNLKAILNAYPIPPGGITNELSVDRFRKHLTALIKTSGIPWANDILRHSYASYQYELTKDAAATAYEMGHKGTEVFFKHYRALVPPGAGKKYFSIIV